MIDGINKQKINSNAKKKKKHYSRGINNAKDAEIKPKGNREYRSSQLEPSLEAIGKGNKKGKKTG